MYCIEITVHELTATDNLSYMMHIIRVDVNREKIDNFITFYFFAFIAIYFQIEEVH